MKHIIYIIACLLAAVCLASCQEEVMEAPSYIYPEYSSYSFGSMPDTVSILIESNVDWTADRDAGWLLAEKTVDEDGRQWLVVSALENEEIEPRTASVILSAGTVSVNITFMQKGASFTGLFEYLPEIRIPTV